MKRYISIMFMYKNEEVPAYAIMKRSIGSVPVDLF